VQCRLHGIRTVGGCIAPFDEVRGDGFGGAERAVVPGPPTADQGSLSGLGCDTHDDSQLDRS
jgi:hypothetical protein